MMYDDIDYRAAVNDGVLDCQRQRLPYLAVTRLHRSPIERPNGEAQPLPDEYRCVKRYSGKLTSHSQNRSDSASRLERHCWGAHRYTRRLVSAVIPANIYGSGNPGQGQ